MRGASGVVAPRPGILGFPKGNPRIPGRGAMTPEAPLTRDPPIEQPDRSWTETASNFPVLLVVVDAVVVAVVVAVCVVAVVCVLVLLSLSLSLSLLLLFVLLLLASHRLRGTHSEFLSSRAGVSDI